MAISIRNVVYDALTITALSAAAVLFVDSRRVPASPPTLDVPPPDSINLSTLFRDTLSGNGVFLRSGAALILVFRSDCPACAVQRSAWLEVATIAAANGHRVLAVTSEPLALPAVRDYFDVPGIELRQLANSADMYAVLGAQYVPTTILLETSGAVAVHESGIMSPEEFDRLKDALRAAGHVGPQPR